jgi:RNA polymerase sigma-70 factor (sigma-E family)
VSGPEDDEFAAFVRERSQGLARTAFLLTGNFAAAEDLLQASLVKVLKRWPALRDRGNADAYVRRVMVTTHASWWRRRWRGELPSTSVPELVSSDETDTVDERAVLFAALKHLPPRQRAAVVLRHYDGLSEAATAAALACSVGTIKSQTARGLATLRKLLAESPLPVSPVGPSPIQKEKAP